MKSKPDDIFSQFSKQTMQTYHTIQSKTLSVMEKKQKDQKEKVISNLEKNKFIAPGTLDMFLQKATG